MKHIFFLGVALFLIARAWPVQALSFAGFADIQARAQNAIINRLLVADALRLAGGPAVICSNYREAGTCQAAGCTWQQLPGAQSSSNSVDCTPADCLAGTQGCQWASKNFWSFENMKDILGIGSGNPDSAAFSGNFNNACEGQKKVATLRPVSNSGICISSGGLQLKVPALIVPGQESENQKEDQASQRQKISSCQNQPLSQCAFPCVSYKNQCREPANALSPDLISKVQKGVSSRTTCMASKTRSYEPGTIAIGDNGTTGVSICTDKGWKPCVRADGTYCDYSDLNLVPKSYQDAYEKAREQAQTEKQKKEIPSEPARTAPRTKPNYLTPI